MSRASFIPEQNWSSKSNDEKYNMMLQCIAKSSAHVMAICEASGLEMPHKRQPLESTNWKLAQSSDTNMVLGVRGKNSTIKVLVDTTDPEYQYRDFTDDPTPIGVKETYLWYMIAEITFGTELDTRQSPHKRIAIERCRQDTFRVATFHINNKAATDRPGNLRLRLRQMVYDLFRYQVDYAGGDANMSIFRYFKGQRIPSITQSSLYRVLMRAKVALNKALALKHALGIQICTSSPVEVLQDADKLASDPNSDWDTNYPDLDSMVAIHFSWGHSSVARVIRDTALESRTDEEKAELQASAVSASGRGLCDYSIEVNEYSLRLGNEHLWLGQSDKDWHRPLITVARLIGKTNVRKRTEAATARRAEKWAQFKGKGKGQHGSSSSQSGTWQAKSSQGK